MQWQDFILTFGSIIFSVALIPSIISKDKPAFSTSVMTGAVLITYAAVYTTLSLWLSAFFITILAILWFTLAVQKYRQGK